VSQQQKASFLHSGYFLGSNSLHLRFCGLFFFAFANVESIQFVRIFA